MRAIWFERPGPAAEVLESGELPTPSAGEGTKKRTVFLR